VTSEVLRRSWVEQVMGLPVSVLARGPGAQGVLAAGAVARVMAELRAVDRRFSLYLADSELSRLNRGELDLPGCHPEVREVARLCAEATSLTGGWFEPRTPTGIWDPSGLVKGWAVERAAQHLAAVPGLDWCLNAGGDVAVLTPSGEPFGVGVQDPRDPQAVLTVLATTTGAVATSGTAARGAHLYDPLTGRPASAPFLSVTVAGPSLRIADVLATAAFVAGGAWRDVVDRAPGYRGYVVLDDGSVEQQA
jgi:thiamine biosynthesis lipoprotein